MELLGMTMRVTGQRGPAIWKVEGSSPGRTYVLISEDDVALSEIAITGKFAQRVEIYIIDDRYDWRHEKLQRSIWCSSA